MKYIEDNGQAIIVYGASTSVGVFVTQFAKRAGFFVVGVAGSSSDYAKSFGADVIVDYRGKSAEELVRRTLYSSFPLKYQASPLLIAGTSSHNRR